MPFANFKVPEAALTRAQKEEIVHRTTAMLVEYFSEAARPHTMVLIEEDIQHAFTIGHGPIHFRDGRRQPATMRWIEVAVS